MFTMSVDNIFWIPTSPEYKRFKKTNLWNAYGGKPWFEHEKKVYGSKIGYIFKDPGLGINKLALSDVYVNAIYLDCLERIKIIDLRV